MYQLLDSGNKQKLEQVGPYRLIRPALNAYWEKTLTSKEWNKADGIFKRNSKGGGQWDWRREVNDSWVVNYSSIKFVIKPTDFGHIGLFPEQEENWQWLMSKKIKNLKVLNMFAYSGGSSLAASKGGANVCHLDASKGMVDWARQNLDLNKDITNGIRWIVDDVNKFVKKEIKRDKYYDGIILDPPSFGRGSKGEVWKIEDQLIPLLENLKVLTNNKPSFILLSMHSNGYSPLSLERILCSVFGQGKLSSGEMKINENNNRKLPAGIFARWESNNL